MNKHYVFTLKLIDYGYNRRQDYVDLPCNRSVLKLIHLLKKEGIIAFFSFKKEFNKPTKVRVFLLKSDIEYEPSLTDFYFKRQNKFFSVDFLNTSSFRPYSNLLINSRPGRKVFCQVPSLRLLSKVNNLIILSTDFGLLTSKSALSLNVGGSLVCTYIL